MRGIDAARVEHPERALDAVGRDRKADVCPLALAQGVDHILTSDDQLIRRAGGFGLACLPTSLVVVLLKDRGRVSRVKPILDRMRQRGFGIDDRRYEEALIAAGEWPVIP